MSWVYRMSEAVRSGIWEKINRLIDNLAMWLKAIVSPAFFWLHIPGGGIFAVVFGYVSARALWEMWAAPQPRE